MNTIYRGARRRRGATVERQPTHTFAATLSDGRTVHCSGSRRHYTHLVEGTHTTGGRVDAVSWHVSADLARQRVSSLRGHSFYRDVRVLPVAALPYNSPEARAVREAGRG